MNDLDLFGEPIPVASLGELAAAINAAVAKADAALDLFKRQRRATLDDYAIAGQLLLTAKAQVEHGQWLPWLEEHCPDLAEHRGRRAQEIMQIARNLETLKSADSATLTKSDALALLNAPDVDSDPITGDLLPETDPATPDPADVIEAQQRHILALERRIDMAAAAAASVTALPATLPAPVVSAEPNQLAVPDPAPKPDGNPIYPDWNASQLERRLRVEQGFAVVASKRNGADGKPIDAALIAWADQQNLMTPIDRSSAWGNPFEMPTDGDRNEVCDRFVEFLTAKPSLLKKIPTLKGKVLVCWCHPERCHGDHLAELANDPAPHHAWYTPGEYIEAARAVMGGIDLDPASCEVAQATVQAVRFFSKEQDGLAQLWQGRVWLNPPFETGAIDRFVAKLIADFKSGAIAQAVILTDSATDTRWFHDLANAARLVCFTKGRISFNSPITDSKNPQRGQAFTYFGDRPAAFAARFKDFGLVVAVQA